MNDQRSRVPATDRNALLEEIRSLGFVKVELELYLDTHPTCRAALDYYHKTLEALKADTEMYEAIYGPLTAAGNTSTEGWEWVNSPWPWHRDDENITKGNVGGR